MADYFSYEMKITSFVYFLSPLVLSSFRFHLQLVYFHEATLFQSLNGGCTHAEKMKGSRLGSAFHDTPAHRRRKGSSTRVQFCEYNLNRVNLSSIIRKPIAEPRTTEESINRTVPIKREYVASSKEDGDEPRY
ncbi:hypothetical protein ANTRET_LOCUS226 [Anthophora retusa]